jgi:hypothetical protein
MEKSTRAGAWHAWSLVFTVCLSGCAKEPPLDPPRPDPAQELQFPDGLRLVLPKHATFTTDRMGNLREINVGWRGGPVTGGLSPHAQAGGRMSSERERKVGPYVFRYSVQREEGGGSGGDEYTIHACREAVPSVAMICFSGMQQGKGEPGFELFWAIAAHATYQAPGREAPAAKPVDRP